MNSSEGSIHSFTPILMCTYIRMSTIDYLKYFVINWLTDQVAYAQQTKLTSKILTKYFVFLRSSRSNGSHPHHIVHLSHIWSIRYIFEEYRYDRILWYLLLSFYSSIHSYVVSVLMIMITWILSSCEYFPAAFFISQSPPPVTPFFTFISPRLQF